jgi:CBS domain-containing protein
LRESKLLISEKPLSKLLGNSLTSTPCVNVGTKARVKVVTGMLVQYLESFTDSVVVREGVEPIGILGGREIIQGVYTNPTSEFFEMNFVEDIMDNRLKVITADFNLQELIEIWKSVSRAFAAINVGNDDFSAISAKKILEIGMNFETDFHISQIPKKKIITFENEATLGEVMKLMLENKSRKILQKDSNLFLNDRTIIEAIENFDYLLGRDNFLDIPITVLKFEPAKVVSNDLNLAEISQILYESSHPLVIYEGSPITRWDVCLALKVL